jgi:hypothetical protein
MPLIESALRILPKILCAIASGNPFVVRQDGKVHLILQAEKFNWPLLPGALFF